MRLNLLNMSQIILHGMTGFIPAVLFYSVIVMAIIRAKGGVENAKPTEFYPNKHIYHPRRVFTYYKVVGYVATAIFLCSALPFIMMYILFNIIDSMAVPIAALMFFAGVILSVKIIKRPDGSVMESLTVDSSTLTVRYRGGGTATYMCRNYAGYNNAGATAAVFIFRDESGVETELRVGGLPAWDMNTLREDLERVKQTGNIAGIKKQPVGAAVTQNSGYDDPQLYAAYLKQEAAKLSAEQKSQLLMLIEAGDKLNAIKYCREWTGIGLKMAKDIVDSYRICLMDDDVQSMAVTAAQPVMPADIPTMPQSVMPAEIPAATSVVNPTVTPESAAAFMSQITAPVTSISGFSFDMPQAQQNNTLWNLRITDNEQIVTDARSLERNIDNALSEIGRKTEEFFVLIPSEPIRGITFMQVCQDKNDVYFHLEAGLTEMNAQGRSKILCKDKLMGWEARNLCMSFYRGDEIYMSDWYELS